MIAANGEHAPSTEQVEIPVALLVVQILPYAPLIALIETDGLEHMDHLFIKMARMQLVALDLTRSDELFDVNTHTPPRFGMQLDASTRS